ncbi:MAG: ThuA domain-containing protein [Bacteroidales bacterium]|nr:ThuA domain-containing protein [Bacteroidales bacterium]
MLFVVAVLLFHAASCTGDSERDKRVLIYTKNGEGFVHKNIAASVAALKKICTAENITTDVSDQPDVFTAENLDQYDAIIFSNSNNEGFDTKDQKKAFQDFIRSGKGFAAIHSANATEREWPWYWALVGGKFVRHAPYQTFDVLVMDPNHPSTSPLPLRWTIEDECYYSNHLNPDIHVLLSADMNSVEDDHKEDYPGETFGELFTSCNQMKDSERDYYQIKIYSLDSDSPFQSLEEFEELPQILNNDEQYLIDGKAYIDAAHDQPAYARIESILLKAFLEMFNEGGEVALFKKLDFNAVFFGEVISGADMPNLIYMTSHGNL